MDVWDWEWPRSLDLMLPAFQKDLEQQQFLFGQIMYLVEFSTLTKQNATAHHVLRWLTTNRNMSIADRTDFLRKPEVLVISLSNDDSIGEYSEEIIVCEREIAEWQAKRD